MYQMYLILIPDITISTNNINIIIDVIITHDGPATLMKSPTNKLLRFSNLEKTS